MSEPDSDEELQLDTFKGIPMELGDFLSEVEEGDDEMARIREKK